MDKAAKFFAQKNRLTFFFNLAWFRLLMILIEKFWLYVIMGFCCFFVGLPSALVGLQSICCEMDCLVFSARMEQKEKVVTNFQNFNFASRMKKKYCFNHVPLAFSSSTIHKFKYLLRK